MVVNSLDLNKIKDLPQDEQQDLLARMKRALFEKEKEELAIQGKKPIRFFEAFHKQELFQKMTKRIRAVSGGNGSGKTVIGVAETIYRVTKTHPFDTAWNARKDPMQLMLLVEDTKQAKQPGAAQDVLISMLPEYIDHEKDIVWDKRGVLDTVHFPDGGKIFMRSARVGRKSIQGSRIHGIHIDESCIKDPDFFDEMMIRITPYGPPLIWITATPNLDADSDDTFFEDVILDRCEDEEDRWDHWGCVKISLWDNPHIDEETKFFLMQNLTGDEDQIRARMEGDHRVKTGLVWPDFSAKLHIIPPISKSYIKENALAIFRVIDPHPVKPIAVAFYACMMDGTLIQFNELNDKGIVSDVAARMRNVCDGLGHLIKATVMDYSGNAASNIAGKSFREEFRAHGVSVVNCIKDTTLSVQEVTKLLRPRSGGGPTLLITSNCKHTIKEFGKYKIDPKTKLPKKKKYGDEFMDNLRYLVVEPLARAYFIERGIGNVKKNPGIHKINEGERQAGGVSSKNSRLRRRREAQERALGHGSGRR